MGFSARLRVLLRQIIVADSRGAVLTQNYVSAV
jgi:hypothetical protein